MFKHIKVDGTNPEAESLTREFNRGMWVVGYTGQSPERMKLHMKHQDTFDTRTSRGMAAPVEGEYYGLPWPCCGRAEMKQTGTPLLYSVQNPVDVGGLTFRGSWAGAAQR